MSNIIPEAWRPSEHKVKVIAYDVITENQHKQSHKLDKPIEFDNREVAEQHFKQEGAEVCLVYAERLKVILPYPLSSAGAIWSAAQEMEAQEFAGYYDALLEKL